jgi:hypothetical protein
VKHKSSPFAFFSLGYVCIRFEINPSMAT